VPLHAHLSTLTKVSLPGLPTKHHPVAIAAGSRNGKRSGPCGRPRVHIWTARTMTKTARVAFIGWGAINTRVGALLADEKGSENASIETRAGVLLAQLIPGGTVTVDMGAPRLGWDEIPLSGAGEDTARVPFPEAQRISHRLPDWFSAVNMGNPHAIFFVEAVDALDLAAFGQRIETDAIFPEKANISLVEKTGENAFKVRVWERAAGITLACGTAACAVAVAAERLGLAKGTITIDLPGGRLSIARDGRDHVMMTGPVATAFAGTIDPSLLAGLS